MFAVPVGLFTAVSTECYKIVTNGKVVDLDWRFDEVTLLNVNFIKNKDFYSRSLLFFYHGYL